MSLLWFLGCFGSNNGLQNMFLGQKSVNPNFPAITMIKIGDTSFASTGDASAVASMTLRSKMLKPDMIAIKI
jgi:hypothetical protein